MKYKLLKRYPSLPLSWKEGMEVGQGDRRGAMALLSPLHGKYEDFGINYHQVINNPEFWELVVEKEYEILTIKSPYGPSLLEGECVDRYIEVAGYKIHSIKRLLDGEVFTVGNKVNNTYCNTKILDFNILWDNELKILTVSGTTVLNNISHVKKPLFFSTDGVDIFEGDSVYWVLQYNDVCKILEYNGTHELHAKILQPEDSFYKTFSTKQKAEEYILFNRPNLSLNDVFEVYSKFKRKETTVLTAHADRLINLAIKKL
jgi:hypothetical protein